MALRETTNHFQNEFVSFFQSYSVAERELTLADIRKIPRFQPGSHSSSQHPKNAFLQIIPLLAWTGIVGNGLLPHGSGIDCEIIGGLI